MVTALKAQAPLEVAVQPTRRETLPVMVLQRVAAESVAEPVALVELPVELVASQSLKCLDLMLDQWWDR